MREAPLIASALAALAGAGVVLGAAAPLSAAERAEAAFDGSFLQPYENVWRMTARQPGGEPTVVGLWTDRLSIEELDGQRTFKRIQGMTWPRGLSSSTINVFDARSLRPLWAENRSPQGRLQRRDFSGGRVSASRAEHPGATEVRAEVDLGRPVYDFWGGMYGLLLAALPLEEGYSTSIPAIDEFVDELKPVAVTVRGRELVRAGCRGTLDAWVVEAEGLTFHLSKEPPYVVKLVYVDPQTKTETTWEML